MQEPREPTRKVRDVESHRRSVDAQEDGVEVPDDQNEPEDGCPTRALPRNHLAQARDQSRMDLGLPVPSPSTGEVLVRVHAAGVGP